MTDDVLAANGRKKKRDKKPDEAGGLRPRRKGDIIRLADGIFSSAVFLIVFALFCSARVGYFLLIALLVTPGVSVLWAFLSSLFIEISFPGSNSDMLLSKKNGGDFCFKVKNKGLLPSTLIRVKGYCTGNMVPVKESENICVRGFGEKVAEFDFCAEYAGKAKVGIGEICVEDFFGIARFPVKKIDSSFRKSFGIMPEIPVVSSKDPILEEAMKTAYGEDNAEDSSDIISYGFSGFPGYDYREYVPGDPLKRINSKLSAKRQTLMVRLDEKPVVAGVVFLLDGARPENADGNPAICGAVENMIETSLGMARTLISRDFGVTVFRKREDGWIMSKVRTEAELDLLTKDLAFFSLYDENKTDDGSEETGSGRIPDKLANGGSIICFTVKADEELLDSLGKTVSGDGDNIRIYNALTGEGRGL